MVDCVFCSILADELPASVVYEDEIAVAFLDIQPINPGHTLVIPRVHVPHLGDLTPETAGRMMQVSQRVAAAIYQSEIEATGVNLLLADGASAGQDVFHTHLHVVPRFEGDGFGFRFPEGYRNKPARRELEGLAAQLRAALPAR